MALGGIIAGALGGGAQAAGGIAQQQLDLNDKQTMARLNQQLEIERNDASQRLGQKIQQENLMFEQGPVAGAKRENAAQDVVSQATTQARPDVLAANQAVENNKIREVGPGGQLIRNGEIVGENTNITMPEVYEQGLRGQGGGANAAERARQWDAKEIDTGLQRVMDGMRKDYVDDATQRPIAMAGNIGSRAYNEAIAAGRSPAQAEQVAYSAVSNIHDEAQQLMRSDKYKDQLKGNVNSAMHLALQLREAKMRAPIEAPGAPATAAPAAAAAPAGPAPRATPGPANDWGSGGPPDPALAGKSAIELSGIAGSPRASASARAAAQAELDRRSKSQSSPARSRDITPEANQD